MNNNSKPQDYTLGQRTVGFQRPVSKKYTPNLAKRHYTLSDPDGRFTSTITLAIKPATQQWPNPALNLQLSNGNGSSFQRLDGLDSLRTLAVFLMESIEEFTPIWEKAAAEGKLIAAAQFDVEQRVAMFKELMEASGQEPPQPPNDYEESRIE